MRKDELDGMRIILEYDVIVGISGSGEATGSERFFIVRQLHGGIIRRSEPSQLQLRTPPVGQLRPARHDRSHGRAALRQRSDRVRQLPGRTGALPVPIPALRLELPHRESGPQRLSPFHHRLPLLDRLRMPGSLDLRADHVQHLALHRCPLLHRVHLEPLYDRIRPLHRHPLPSLVPREAIDQTGRHLRHPRLGHRQCHLRSTRARVGRSGAELRLRQLHGCLPVHPLPVSRVRHVLGVRIFLHPVPRHHHPLLPDIQDAPDEAEKRAEETDRAEKRSPARNVGWKPGAEDFPTRVSSIVQTKVYQDQTEFDRGKIHNDH